MIRNRHPERVRRGGHIHDDGQRSTITGVEGISDQGQQCLRQACAWHDHRFQVGRDMHDEAAGALEGEPRPHIVEQLRNRDRFRLVRRNAAGSPAHLVENRLAPIDLAANQASVIGECVIACAAVKRALQLARGEGDGPQRRRQLVRRAGG